MLKLSIISCPLTHLWYCRHALCSDKVCVCVSVFIFPFPCTFSYLYVYMYIYIQYISLINLLLSPTCQFFFLSAAQGAPAAVHRVSEVIYPKTFYLLTSNKRRRLSCELRQMSARKMI